jgi:hypothetical protein
MFAHSPVLEFSWCIRLYHENSACGIRSYTMPPLPLVDTHVRNVKARLGGLFDATQHRGLVSFSYKAENFI